MRRFTRSLAAVVTGAALLLLGAPPAMADAPTAYTGGVLTINLVPTLTIDLTEGTGPCPVPQPVPPLATSFLTLAMTPSGAANPYSLTTTLSTVGDQGDFVYGGATYFLRNFTASSSIGALINNTSGADPFLNGNLSSVGMANIYPETSPGSCTPSSSPLCTAIRINPTSFLPLAGSFTGGLTGATPYPLKGAAVLSSSAPAVIQASGCVAPFSALNLKTLSISNMAVTF